jgi:hypothetical protein
MTMWTEREDTASADADLVDDLRDATMDAGARLGWEPPEVASFARKLTGRPWEELGADDLYRVVEELWELGQVVAARPRRPIGGDRARPA